MKHRKQRRQRQRGRGEMSQRLCRRFNSGSGVDVRMLLEKCKKNVFILILLSTHTNMKAFDVSVRLYLWWADEFYWLWKCLYHLFPSLRLKLRDKKMFNFENQNQKNFMPVMFFSLFCPVLSVSCCKIQWWHTLNALHRIFDEFQTQLSHFLLKLLIRMSI